MATQIAKLLQFMIDEGHNVEADKFILGYLPKGEKMGVYTGKPRRQTPDEFERMKQGHDCFLALVKRAEVHIGLARLPFKSEFPGGMLPVRFHIPKNGGWFEADGFSCHLLPHIVLELETRCRRKHAVGVTMLKNGSYVINIGKIK